MQFASLQPRKTMRFMGLSGEVGLAVSVLPTRYDIRFQASALRGWGYSLCRDVQGLRLGEGGTI